MTPLQTQLRRWRDAEAGMTDGLRECPHCGKLKTPYLFEPHNKRSKQRFFVMCAIEFGGCGSQTGYWRTADLAKTAWNTRAVPPLTPAMLDGLTEVERLLTEMACEGEIVGKELVHLPNCRKCAAIAALTAATTPKEL